MRGVFIAGTSTGVGKTLFTGLLAKYLSQKGACVITQKWVQTGVASFKDSDVKKHWQIMGKDFSVYKKYTLPYIFKPAASPHLAAKMCRKTISAAKIKKSLTYLSRRFDYVIVEGTGGLLVPLNKKVLMIDLVRDFKLPVILVAENSLGAINHTLLALEALKARRMKVLGVIFNRIKKEKDFISKDNPGIVSFFAKNIKIWNLG